MPQCSSITLTSTRTWTSHWRIITSAPATTLTCLADRLAESPPSKCTDKSCWLAAGELLSLELACLLSILMNACHWRLYRKAHLFHHFIMLLIHTVTVCLVPTYTVWCHDVQYYFCYHYLWDIHILLAWCTMWHLAVCLSIASRSFIKMDEPIKLVFSTEVPLIHSTGCWKNELSPKIMFLPSGNLSQTWT